MRNSILQIFIISTLVVLFQGLLALPWWLCVIAAFTGGFFIKNKGGFAFLSGFIAVLFIWFSWAMIKDSSTSSILSGQVAQLLPGKPTTILLALVSGLVAAIPSGFATWTGNVLRRLLKNTNNN